MSERRGQGREHRGSAKQSLKSGRLRKCVFRACWRQAACELLASLCGEQ